MQKRVCINPGHGGIASGAVYGDLKEKDIVLTVAKYVVEGLNAIAPEIWVGLTRIIDQTMSLQAICDSANNMNVDCFVSIHCNADPDDDKYGSPEGKGEEIWFYDKSVNGLKLAQCLADEVDRIFPDEPFRGIKSTRPDIDKPQGEIRPYFYVLAKTNAAACLIELGFIDRSSSVEVFSDELSLRKMGALIARGIHKYLEMD